MKRKVVKRGSNRSRESGKMKGTLGRLLQVQLHQHQPSAANSSSLFARNLLDSEPDDPSTSASALDLDAADDKDFILSQDFFCTPDYITPDNQNLMNGFDCNNDNIPCPKSPEKLHTVKSKRPRQDGIQVNPLSPTFSGSQQIVELAKDNFDVDEVNLEKTVIPGVQKTKNYVSQSAVALRCRVMPPPCIKNPYLKDASEMDMDPLGNQRSKCAGFFPAIIGGDGLSRYHTDFHEIEQIGTGNFSRVFKVLKRIDGCLYAVKHTTRPLHQDTERRKALMEVQALGALGSHENIVGYYSSWFENEQLYIQMELCDCSLSRNTSSQLFTEGEVLRALLQIAKALECMHERGIAHLDVKPENIYVKNGVYKLGDFGCATLLNKSLPIEEGDARYMSQEILNENYDHLDKVDIFSLGVTIYELIRGSPLPESGHQFLREGKLPLLPGHSLQFQNLLKVMVDQDPVRRPSAKELIENPIFDKILNNAKA
ncbi:wee1-like protein kinase isoform X2 [Herrania umbratica]|uniref:Wee1-like protein kinase n=1 Tax=Herrania umbratica TaxID=108875 RepID=A0A6J1A1Z6_9ROSI|nr:wee1-like protein kinase isoform X2 [Herrania umbratica]